MFVKDYSDFKTSEEESILKHELKLRQAKQYGSIGWAKTGTTFLENQENKGLLRPLKLIFH